jgi:hypothetical protein
VATKRVPGLGWTLGAGGVLVLGLGARVAIGGWGVGDRSALVMAGMFGVGAWLTARLLSGPRAACLVTVAVVAVLDLAALPARNAPEYDGVRAFYRTDQVLSTQLALPAGIEQGGALSLLAQAVFAGAQPTFGLAGEVNGTPLAWTCDWQRGMGRVALPLPPTVVANGSSVEVRLALTGSPSRESDYLIVYSTSRRGGFVLSLEAPAAADAGPETTRCALV